MDAAASECSALGFLLRGKQVPPRLSHFLFQKKKVHFLFLFWIRGASRLSHLGEGGRVRQGEAPAGRDVSRDVVHHVFHVRCAESAAYCVLGQRERGTGGVVLVFVSQSASFSKKKNMQAKVIYASFG